MGIDQESSRTAYPASSNYFEKSKIKTNLPTTYLLRCHLNIPRVKYIKYHQV